MSGDAFIEPCHSAMAGVGEAGGGAVTRLEQRGGGAIAFMAAAPWIMLPIAAAILAETTVA